MLELSCLLALCSYLTSVIHVQAVVEVRWMCSPSPLRLCCMAAMAPALTEAATQNRGKLPSSPPEPHNPTLVNGRDCATPPPDVKERGLGRSSPKTNGFSNSQSNIAPFITRKDLVNSRLVGVPSAAKPASLVNLGTISGAAKPASLVNLGTITNLSDIYKQHNQKSSHSATKKADKNHKVNSSQSGVKCAMNGREVTMPNKSGVIGFISNISNSTGKQFVTTSSHTQEQNNMPTKQKVLNVDDVIDTNRPGQHNDNEIQSAGVNTASSSTVTVNSVSSDNKSPVIKTEAMSEFTTASIDLAVRKQKNLARRTERLERRIRRLQARQSNTHVQQQLSGFVDSQHETLQSLARSIRVPSNTTDLKAELLQSQDVKNLSTAALVNLVRKVQSSQAISLRQRLTSTGSVQQPEPNSILKLDVDLSCELGSVSGQLTSNLHHVEKVLDSDATESSSGGESADEGDSTLDWGNRYTHRLPIHRRAEWKWTLDRAAVAARWTWLQAQVSDLEYRIRQQSDIYRQIRATKGAVVLGEQLLPEDLLGHSKPSRTGRKLSPIEAKIASIEKKNEMSPCNLSTMLNNVDLQSSKLAQSLGGLTPQSSPVVNNALNSSKSHFQSPKPINGFIDTNSDQLNQSGITNKEDSNDLLTKKVKTDNSSQHETACLDSTCQAARCRPPLGYRKRKLLRTSGLHQFSRKAARLSTVKCQCHPPYSSCVMCGGRYNNTQSLDSETMSLQDRVALLDPAYHPVLSFSQEIPLPVHFEALLKSGDWQNKQTAKPSKAQGSERKRGSGEPVRKYNKKVARNASVSLLSTANKLRSRLLAEGKQLSRGHAGSLPTTPTGRNNSRTPLSERLVRSSDFKIKKRSAALRTIGNSSIQRKSGLGRQMKSSSASPSPTMLDMPSPMSQSGSSSTLREMKDAMKRRRGESAFDINNIVIPYSIAASTRVQKLQYKEIQTPKWRVVDEMTSEEPETMKASDAEEEVKVLPGDNGVISHPMEAVDEDSGEETEEDVGEVAIAARHLRCEILEKKRFITFTNQQKRPRHSRTDSGTLTPDPTTPDLAASEALSVKITLSVDADDQKPLSVSSLDDSTGLTIAKVTEHNESVSQDKEEQPSLKLSRPATPLADTTSNNVSGEVVRSASSSNLDALEEDKQAVMRRTMSCTAQLSALSEVRLDEVKEGKSMSMWDDLPASRSRSSSISKSHCRDRSSSAGEDRSKNCTPDISEVREVMPWEKRAFPISEEDYEYMKLESVTPTPKRRTSYERPDASASTSTPISGKGGGVTFTTGTPVNSNPCSPLPSSSGSSVLEDDPNDPEWTVIQPERKPGIVLKLTKR